MHPRKSTFDSPGNWLASGLYYLLIKKVRSQQNKARVVSQNSGNQLFMVAKPSPSSRSGSMPSHLRAGMRMMLKYMNMLLLAMLATSLTARAQDGPILSGGTTVCQYGNRPTITISGTGGAGQYGYIYYESFNGSTPQSKTISGDGITGVSFQVNTEQAGTYTFQMYGFVKETPTPTVFNPAYGKLVVVTIYSLPSGAIGSAEPDVSGVTNVCQSTDATVTFTGNGGSGSYTYTYSIKDPDNNTTTGHTISGGTTVTINVPTLFRGLYTYTLTGITDSVASCTGLVSGPPAKIRVNAPTARISKGAAYSVGVIKACQHKETPEITFSGEGGSGDYTFTYSLSAGGSTKTDTITGKPDITFRVPLTTTGQLQYQLIGVTDNKTGCTAPVNGAQEIAVIDVYAPPSEASIGGTATVCRGSEDAVVSFTGKGSTGQYLFSYSLSDGATTKNLTANGSARENGPSTIVFAPARAPGVYTYKLDSVSEAYSGCSIRLTDQSAVITVAAPPEAAVGRAATYVCQNAPSPDVIFSGSKGSGSYKFSYSLSQGSNTTEGLEAPGSPEAKISAPTGVPGVYIYTLTGVTDSVTSCAGSVMSSTAAVIVHALPGAGISGTATVCQNGERPFVTFSGESGSGGYEYTYSLDNGSDIQGGLTASGGATVYFPVPTATPGTYTYLLTKVTDKVTGCTQDINNQPAALITVSPIPNAGITTSSAVTAASAGNRAFVTNAGRGAKYSWSITDGAITSGGDTDTITYTAGNSDAVSLSVQVSAGACDPVSASVKVPVTPLPCPKADIDVASAVCSASTGNIASVVDAGDGATYAWSITNGTIMAGKGTNQITFTAASSKKGTGYTSSDSVMLSVSVTNKSKVCTVSSGVYRIFISPAPSAKMLAATSVCSRSSGNIARVQGVCQKDARYTWSITNGSITSGAGSRMITYTAGASGSVSLTLTVSSGSGCKAASATKQIAISGLPGAALTTASSVCAGSYGNVASVPSVGKGAIYVWGIQNGAITAGSATNSIKYTAGKSGSVTIKVMVKNSTGCAALSGDKKVTIVSAPNTSITTPSSVCAGSSGNKASVASAGSGATYSWNISNGTITAGSKTSSITYTAGPFGRVTLCVTITNSSGCKASGRKTITIGGPVSTITSSSAICTASTGNAASVVSAGSGASYAWAISNGTSITYTAGSSGVVKLSVTVANSSGCKASGSRTVSISPKKVPIFNQVAAICQNAKAPVLPAKSNNGITGTWSPSKINTASVKTTTYTFTPASGQCAVPVTMAITVKACAAKREASQTEARMITPEAVAETKVWPNPAQSETASTIEALVITPEVIRAKVWPNPTQSSFNLAINGNNTEPANIVIFDIQGRQLEQRKAATGQVIRFGDSYKAGMYIAEIQQGVVRKVIKMIKQ